MRRQHDDVYLEKRIPTDLTYRPLQFLLPLLLLANTSLAAAAAEPFPGVEPDSRLIKAQEKGDELFEKGDYERAMLIYRNELAPVGDKFAQYMVGYMYLTAKGVEEDGVLASAWYRLAAERGHEAYERARNILLDAMNDAQRRRSDQLYSELRNELGDIALISNMITADLTRLRQRNTLKAGTLLTPADLSDPFRNDDYARRVGEQMEERMNYLVGIADADKSLSDEERYRIDDLNMEVAKVLESLR